MFRRGLAAILVLGACGADAYAADLDMPMTISAPSMTARWQGFSFGGYVAGNWSGGQSVDQSWYAPYAGFSSTAPTSMSVQTIGGGGGVQFGYDKQYGQLVTGIMADYGFLGGAKGTSSYSGSITLPNAGWVNVPFNGRYSQQLNGLGTARWRLGYAPNNDWLIYGDAGLGFGNTTTTSSLQMNNGFANYGSRSGSAVGYTVGAGVQYSMGSNWSLGLDGLYYNLGNRDTVAVANYVTTINGNIAPSPQMSSSGNFSGFQLRLTALYQYDGASEAQVFGSTDPNTDVPLTVGMRAGYSTGQSQLNLNASSSGSAISRLTYKNADSFTAEPYFNVDLPSWNLYLTGFVGIGQQRSGSLQDQDFTPYTNPYSSTNSSLSYGQLEYGVVDVGYNWLQTPEYKVGTFAGYTFENDSYNASGCTQTATNPLICTGGPALSGIASNTLAISDQFSWNAARIGVSGSYRFAGGLSLSGDAAWLPYVNVSETNYHWLRMPGDFNGGIPGSGSSSEGFQVAAKVDYRISPGFDIGAGVRYWWMTARGNVNFSDVSSGAGSQSASWSTERMQAFLETGYHF